jgi:hypothetical protein
MSLTAAARRRTCERQLDRLDKSDLERHEVLNIATTLLLLLASIDGDSTEDVEGHGVRVGVSAEAPYLTAVRRNLDWIRFQGHLGDVEEVRHRLRSAAEELSRRLRDVPAGEANG